MPPGPNGDASGDLSVTDVRVFVPALDFAVSRDFYLALGWTELWSDGGLSLLDLADHRFLLQDYYVADWANNFMLVVEVASADAWHARVAGVLAERSFGSARVREPVDEDWGARVTYVWDPSGVLVHFIQWLTRR